MTIKNLSKTKNLEFQPVYVACTGDEEPEQMVYLKCGGEVCVRERESSHALEGEREGEREGGREGGKVADRQAGMSSDAHAHVRTHAHMRARTRAHSPTISAGQEYEFPYPLEKADGEEEEAWAIKDGNQRSVLKLSFRCVNRLELLEANPADLAATADAKASLQQKLCSAIPSGADGGTELLSAADAAESGRTELTSAAQAAERRGMTSRALMAAKTITGVAEEEVQPASTSMPSEVAGVNAFSSSPAPAPPVSEMQGEGVMDGSRIEISDMPPASAQMKVPSSRMSKAPGVAALPGELQQPPNKAASVPAPRSKRQGAMAVNLHVCVCVCVSVCMYYIYVYIGRFDCAAATGQFDGAAATAA